jgi:hypothetical protein
MPGRGHGEPGGETTAADRGHDHVEFGLLGEHLERDRALTRDHRRVVERVDELEIVGGGQLPSPGGRLHHVGAGQHHLGAEVAGAGDLDERRVLGHDDRRRETEQGTMVGDALGMVAG